MTLCDCGCGNETGSPEFYKLHVMTDLERLIYLSEAQLFDEGYKKEYESIKAKIQGLIDIADSDLGVKICDLINENTKLKEENDVVDDKRIQLNKALCLAQDEIAKLKDEQGMMFNHRGVIAKLREKDDFNLSMIAKLKEELETAKGNRITQDILLELEHEEVEKLQSTLDEIDSLIVSIDVNNSGKSEVIITTNNYGESKQLLKLLAKHEDKK